MNSRITKSVWRRTPPAIAPIALTAVLIAGVLGLGLVAYAVASGRRGHWTHQRSTFWLRVSPSRETISVGSTARYRIKIQRLHLHGPVKLRVLSGVPRGARVRLSLRRTRRARSVLIVSTSGRTPPGKYLLRLRARHGRLRRTVRVTLVVRRRSPNGVTASVGLPPFTIGGDVEDPLEPGVPQALDLTIANPNSLPLTLSSLTVTITTLTAPSSTPALPCTLADFAVQQYSGSYPLVIPPSSSRSLQALGLPAAEWPQVSLVDLPHNQDGCQRASLNLLYSAGATLG